MYERFEEGICEQAFNVRLDFIMMIYFKTLLWWLKKIKYENIKIKAFSQYGSQYRPTAYSEYM